MSLRPFFCYYGGKFRAAPLYPHPEHEMLIEPFAGAAGYATRYPDRRVFLIDKDPIIAGLWKYLTKVSESEILALSDIRNDQTVDDLGSVPQEARWLVGFWLNKGCAVPKRSPSTRMRSGARPLSHWGPTIRGRIAAQIGHIRHWQVYEGSYDGAPAMTATWFIDPPYRGAGAHYTFGSKQIDFPALAEWCRARRGQTIVCENAGANWLPFRHLGVFHANVKGGGVGGRTAEAVYVHSEMR